jgi:hypothetical protein
METVRPQKRPDLESGSGLTRSEGAGTAYGAIGMASQAASGFIRAAGAGSAVRARPPPLATTATSAETTAAS